MANTQALNIQQAREGEVYGDMVITNSQTFQAELHKNNVKDLFDTRLTIKQDKEKYIFAIDGVNKFAVNGKTDFTTFIHDFYKNLAETEKWSEQKKAVINVYEFEKQTKVEITITETAQELTELQSQIKKNEQLAEKNTDIENVKHKVERLIGFYEQEKKLAQSETSGRIFNTKYDRKDKGLRNIQKVEINRRIKQLENIKEQIERLQNNKNKKYKINRDNQDGKYVEMDDVNGMDMNITLKQLSDKINDLGKEAPDFILNRNSIIIGEGGTVPYFEIMGYSNSDAKKLNRALNKVNKDYAILDELKLTGAKRQEVSQDLQDLEKYLNNVINHPDTFKPSEHPFVPTHTKDFFELMNIKPTPEQYKEMSKTADKKPETTSAVEQAPKGIYTLEPKPGTNTPAIQNYANKDYIETFKAGGVTGVIKKTLNIFPNMSNEAKNTWTNLLVVGGVGFGVFKLAKWLFSGKRNKDQKEKTPRWQRLLIIGGVTLGANAFGTNPFNVAQKFIGGGLDFNALKMQRPSVSNEIVKDEEKELAYTELNVIFGNLPVSKLKEFVDPKTFKLTEGGYNGLLRNFQGIDADSGAKRAILEKIRKNKDNDILKTSFAKVGITPENIDNLNQNKTIKEYTESSIPTLDNTVDTRDEVDDTRINITEQVKNFNITEDQKKKLVKYGNILYDEKPGSSSQKVEFKEKDTKIYLKTYDERTSIDIEKLTIVGYKREDTSPIVFSGYKELLKAANITNYMKSIFRGKAKGTMYNTPFEKAGLIGKLTRDRGDIMFNDGTNNKYNPTHTEAIDGGRFGTLGKVSKTLEDNKEAYINYLNDLNIWNETRVAEEKPST